MLDRCRVTSKRRIVQSARQAICDMLSRAEQAIKQSAEDDAEMRRLVRHDMNGRSFGARRTL